MGLDDKVDTFPGRLCDFEDDEDDEDDDRAGDKALPARPAHRLRERTGDVCLSESSSPLRLWKLDNDEGRCYCCFFGGW